MGSLLLPARAHVGHNTEGFHVDESVGAAEGARDAALDVVGEVVGMFDPPLAGDLHHELHEAVAAEGLRCARR